MAIKQESIGETFTDDQKSLIALYEKQIDDHMVKYYLEGKKLDVKPEPYPYSHREEKHPWGLDERVVNEILRKYREAGWRIEWVFNETSQISGDWVFRLNKISDLADFKGKKLKISFTHKDSKLCITEHKLNVPILGSGKTKAVSEIEKDQTEYINLYIPSIYITDVDIIKFVRYYDKDKRWIVCLQNEAFVLENLKVEVI